MFKKISLTAAALAMSASALVPAASAATLPVEGGSNGGGYATLFTGGDADGANAWQNRNRRDRQYYGRSYNDRRYAYNRQRAREKCNDGDGGTLVGAVAGGLIGSQVAGRGDKTLGVILGGAVGALAGREIDRSDRPNYCRR